MTCAARHVTTPPIHCMGDSHVAFFSGRDAITPPWPEPADDRLPWFKTYHIGAALAYNLTRTGTFAQGRERLMAILSQHVPAGATVLLSFGEIDCRAHLVKQAEQRGLPLEHVVDYCLDEYFKAVVEVAEMGFHVVVYNALCSRSRMGTDGKRKDGGYTAYGTCRERTRAVALFNAGAKQRCELHGMSFLETVPYLNDRRGQPPPWYFLDRIHLSQRAMPVTLRELAKLFPELGIDVPPIPEPTLPRRLADWLERRGRRVRRELSKITGRS